MYEHGKLSLGWKGRILYVSTYMPVFAETQRSNSVPASMQRVYPILKEGRPAHFES
jgi:hypothetical protein